jgi:hypothetical protein
VVSPAKAGKKPAYVYGPLPEWTEYKALGTQAALTLVPDPQQWAVEWPNGVIKYEWDHKGRFPGYLTCGVLRATGPVEGKRRLINFIVVIDYGVVRNVDPGSRDLNHIVNQLCREWPAKGLLPPASVMMANAARSVPTLGLSFRPLNDGAHVTAVADGTPAYAAGVRTGMVIAKVNGLPLAGMGAAMTTLLSSDAATLTAETASGETLVLRKAP